MKYFFIPFAYFLFFIAVIQIAFFYKSKFMKPKKKENDNDNDFLYVYEEHIKKRIYVFILFLVFNILFSIILYIPYLLLYIYFKTFLILISIFFKFYPLKFFLGIIFVDYPLYIILLPYDKRKKKRKKKFKNKI